MEIPSRKLSSIISRLLPFKISLRIRKKKEKRKLNPLYRESDERIRGDEYIRWVCFVTGGWLRENDGNLRGFDHAIKSMPARGSVVEIGSYLGLSTNILIYLMNKHGRTNPVFNCDPWVFEDTEKPIGGYFDAAREDYRDYSKGTFIRNMKVFCRDALPHSIEAFSDDFFADWDQGMEVKDLFDRPVKLGGDICFAYIDGAHTYEASKTDFENVDRHIVVGGFVFFDDSGDDGPFESSRTAQEVLTNPRYELVFKTPNYLFRRI